MSSLPPIILASSSVYRKQQLDALGLVYTAVIPDVDERVKPNETADELVLRLAISKAKKIKAQSKVACMIGADQVCVFAGDIYGKPGNRENAINQLQKFSDNSVEFLTAVSVIDSAGEVHTHVDQTVVQFRVLTPQEINRYIDKEKPFDCAGSFKVEALGLSLFESVVSNDPSALMGLPLIKLSEYLRMSGYQIP